LQWIFLIAMTPHFMTMCLTEMIISFYFCCLHFFSLFLFFISFLNFFSAFFSLFFLFLFLFFFFFFRNYSDCTHPHTVTEYTHQLNRACSTPLIGKRMARGLGILFVLWISCSLCLKLTHLV
jgi:hypothetical protein